MIEAIALSTGVIGIFFIGIIGGMNGFGFVLVPLGGVVVGVKGGGVGVGVVVPLGGLLVPVSGCGTFSTLPVLLRLKRPSMKPDGICAMS